MGLRAGGERGRLLVADADPFDAFTLADFLQQAVERVADDAINPLHTRRDQRLNKNFCDDFLSHNFASGLANFLIILQVDQRLDTLRHSSKLWTGIAQVVEPFVIDTESEFVMAILMRNPQDEEHVGQRERPVKSAAVEVPESFWRF